MLLEIVEQIIVADRDIAASDWVNCCRLPQRSRGKNYIPDIILIRDA